MVESSFKK